MFDNCPAPHPYWYIADNAPQAIKSYELQDKLEIDLNISSNKEHRIKL